MFGNAKKESKQGQMGERKREQQMRETERGRGREEDRKSIKDPGREYAPVL